jgi:uncharacterized membrane protein YfcA
MLPTLFLASGLGLLAGLLIGAIGIGGVILVPALAYLGSVPIQAAIGAAMMGFVPTGAVGAFVYARHGSIRWSLALWICLGALPGALLGAWLGGIVDPRLLEAGIALLVLLAGANALLGRPEPESAGPGLGPAALLAIGAVTGLVSAMTGTGGPVTLMPILLWLGMPVLASVGLAQAAQLPIALTATLGYLALGTLDLGLGLLLGLTVAGGTALGARLAHVLPVTILHRLVAFVLVLVGLAMIGKLAGVAPT